MVVGVTVPLMVALTVFVKFTPLGKAMRATAQNPTAAQLMGINIDRVIGATFAIGGALAGAASVVYGLYDQHGQLPDGLPERAVRLHRGRARRHRQHPRGGARRAVIGLVRSLGSAYVGESGREALIFGILIVDPGLPPDRPARRAARGRR